LSETTVALVAIRAIRMAVCLSTKTNYQIAQDLQQLTCHKWSERHSHISQRVRMCARDIDHIEVSPLSLSPTFQWRLG